MKQDQPKRSASASSSIGSNTSDDSSRSFQTSRSSTASGATVRTWSHDPGAVTFERSYLEGLHDDDIITVPVKLENKFRKSSVDGAEELPPR